MHQNKWASSLGSWASRGKTETPNEIKISKAITNGDKCYEEQEKETLQKNVYDYILDKN